MSYGNRYYISMETEKYALRIGKIFTNLQALEFLIRARLLDYEIQENISSSSFSIKEIKLGDVVEENAFTNYKSLGLIIEDYNANIAKGDSEKVIDADIVSIRDALAHGRVSSWDPRTDSTLMKFSRSKDGKVEVTDCQELTSDWLDHQITRTYRELMKVAKDLQ